MRKTISAILIFLVMILASIPGYAMKAGNAQIVSNGETTFLIESDGSVKGWGKNSYGEVGNGNKIDQHSPVIIEELKNIKEIVTNEAGFGYFYAIDNAGKVYSWGYSGYGVLGQGYSQDLTPQIISGLPTISQIVLNEYTTYAITTDGDVYAWGMNDYGQIGNYTKTNQLVPYKVGYLPKVSSIVCKAKVTFAITQDKNVYAWGRGDDFQTGTGIYASAQLIPVQITDLSNVDEVITNGTTSFAICNNRQDVYSWGEGWNDELGTYSERNREPKRLWILSDLNETIEELVIESITCFAIMSDDTLYGWGENSYNQLGNGGSFDQGVPMVIQNIPKVKEFIFNGQSGIVLGVDNTVYSWGKNTYGTVGIDIYRQAYAEKVTALGNNIVQIYDGFNTMYAKDSNGTIYGWGTNSYGQAGIGTYGGIVTPTVIPDISNIIEISKANYTVFASDTEGVIYGWGENDYGQLGDGTTNNALSPTIVSQSNITTTTGIGDVNSVVPIVGSINALTISITHPANISYTIDPNNTEGFYCTDITIQNNSKVPVNISIQSFEASADGDLEFTDVLPEDKDWNSLNRQETKSFISLGIRYSDEAQWLISLPELINPLYAVEINNTYAGALAKSTSGTLNLCGMHGLAFDGNFTARHELVFVFSLV